MITTKRRKSGPAGDPARGGNAAGTTPHFALIMPGAVVNSIGVDTSPAIETTQHPARPSVAERIREAAREEYAKRGFHGARVQRIARAAGCNVAIIYRHWTSKETLYVDILKAAWLTAAQEIEASLEHESGQPGSAIELFADALFRDPLGAQILVREYLDGAPHIQKMAEKEPALLEPLHRATESFVAGDWRRHAAELVLRGLLRGSGNGAAEATMTDSG
jgi:AcrR family transcriptional regulator